MGISILVYTGTYILHIANVSMCLQCMVYHSVNIVVCIKYITQLIVSSEINQIQYSAYQFKSLHLSNFHLANKIQHMKKLGQAVQSIMILISS